MLAFLALVLLVGLRIALAVIGLTLFLGSATCVAVSFALAFLVGGRLPKRWAIAAIVAALLGFLFTSAGAAF